jgi:hypothetical protein
MKLFLIFCFVCGCSTVFAWGGDGHQVTALIAEDRLMPEVKSKIHELLGPDVNISDAEVASWADVIKRAHPKQGPWHYVDIPAAATGYDAKRDGRDGDNVIDKINEFEQALSDKSKPKEERAQALRFLVHLVGDIHQPLHCAERDNDKGGNAVKIEFLDRQSSKLNLHQAWDSLILIAHKGKTRNAAYADSLNAKISEKQAEEWSKGTPENWANESHEIAAKVIYHDLSATTTQPARISESDVNRYGKIIDEQLERGGVRLSMILNRALR